MYNDLSKIAQSQTNTFANSLQYLVEQQNKQKVLDQTALTQRYDALINQINQQKMPILQQYDTDTQSAYVNKMMGQKQLTQNLSQAGLNTGGFGIGQQQLNETAYGQNYASLTNNKNTAINNLNNNILNASSDYNASNTELASTYQQRLTELQKYISEATQNKYNDTYSQLLNAKQYENNMTQQQYENKLAEKQYADKLAQQAWENSFNNRQLNASISGGSGGRGGFTDTSGNPPVGIIPTADPTVGARYSPVLSSKTANTFYNTLGTKPMTQSQLVAKLQSAYKTKTISESDIKKILKAYGLE